MSIANLNGANFPIIINDLLTTNIDTPLFGQTLSIGVANANPTIIGQPGVVLLVKSRLDTNIIDADVSVGPTLFIAPNNATDVAIGNPGGNPVTCVSGILTNNINMGGSLGAGTLLLGNGPSSTEVDIGQPAAPIKLLGSTVQFPSSALPLIIANSGVSQTVTVAYTGAIANAAGASLSFYRFGDWVTVDFRNLIPVQAVTAGFPISMIAVIPLAYRPVNNRTFVCMVQDVGANVAGSCTIFISGSINIGSVTDATFHAGTGGTYDWSHTYNING